MQICKKKDHNIAFTRTERNSRIYRFLCFLTGHFCHGDNCRVTSRRLKCLKYLLFRYLLNKNFRRSLMIQLRGTSDTYVSIIKTKLMHFPRLSIMIIYNSKWSILIQWIVMWQLIHTKAFFLFVINTTIQKFFHPLIKVTVNCNLLSDENVI